MKEVEEYDVLIQKLKVLKKRIKTTQELAAATGAIGFGEVTCILRGKGPCPLVHAARLRTNEIPNARDRDHKPTGIQIERFEEDGKTFSIVGHANDNSEITELVAWLKGASGFKMEDIGIESAKSDNSRALTFNIRWHKIADPKPKDPSQ